MDDDIVIHGSWSCQNGLVEYGFGASLHDPGARFKPYAMKTKPIRFSVCCAVLLAVGLTACKTHPESEAKVGRKEAEVTALSRAPGGSVKEAELEREDGQLVWSFDIVLPGTTDITEVLVDAMTGAVVSVETETAADEQKEASSEHEAHGH
jgi:hypothetical protein